MNDLPKVVSSEMVFNEFVKIRREELLYPSSHKLKYYTLELPNSAVCVLGKTKEGHFIINKEYRHPTRKVLLSAPGGFIGEDELPEEAAKREFLEETGYVAESFIVMGESFPLPGLSSQKVYFVLAKNAVWKQKPNLEPSEIIETVILKEEELYSQILQGAGLDGILGTALCFYQLHQLKK